VDPKAPPGLYQGVREVIVRVRYKYFDATRRDFVWIPLEMDNPREYVKARALLMMNRLLHELLSTTL